MKIDCKHRKQELRREAQDSGTVTTRLWKKSLPFNVNPRGVLIHRVRTGLTILYDGEHSHDAVHYWCSNGVSGEGVNLTDVPPTNRLLCSHCERLAVEAGEPTAEELAGRHVCIGVLKACRLCCRNEGN